MRVSIVTPDASFYDDDADAVVLKSMSGEFGILPRHAPMIARLGHGVARVTQGETVTRVAVFGGFVKVQDDVVSVLAGGARLPEGDLAVAETEWAAAVEALKAAKAEGKPAPDVADAEEKERRARTFRDLLRTS